MIGFVISDRKLIIDGIYCEEFSKRLNKFVYFTEYNTGKGVFVSLDDVIAKGLEVAVGMIEEQKRVDKIVKENKKVV